jgi:polyisoprenoid-binding protein YceI
MADEASTGRRWVKWAIGAVVAVLVVVVGGPFVYIHFIEGKPPPPLSLASQATTTAQPGTASTTASSVPASSAGDSSSGGVDGTWNVTSGSQAGYRVKETLFGQSNTAVGRTSAVTGKIVVQGTSVTSGTFSVDLTKVSSDQSQRDQQFRGRIMQTSQFPTATLTLTAPIQVASVPADGAQTTANATGDLTMHGVTKSVTFQVTAQRSGGTIAVSGSIPITFADWKIDNPSGGPAQTEDHGIMEFLVNLAHE